LENKVFDIVDARCNREVHVFHFALIFNTFERKFPTGFRLPKHALNYKTRGRRDRGRPRKRWQCVDAGTDQTT